MAYVKEMEITELESVVKNIWSQFFNFAHHEAIYIWGDSSLTKPVAGRFYDLCLEGEITLETLVHELRDLKKDNFLRSIKPYLSHHLVEVCSFEETSVDRNGEVNENGANDASNVEGGCN